MGGRVCVIWGGDGAVVAGNETISIVASYVVKSIFGLFSNGADQIRQVESFLKDMGMTGLVSA